MEKVYKRRHKKLRGSMTVFAALCAGLFLSAVFAFLEAARVSELKTNARLSTLQAADSLLSEYNNALFSDYGVLFWQGSEEGGYRSVSAAASQQEDFVAANYEDSGDGENYYLLGLTLSDVTVDGYELATDNGGSVFRVQAAQAVKGLLAEDAVSTLKDWIETAEEGGTDETELSELEDTASDTLATLQEAQSSLSEELSEAKTTLSETKAKIKKLKKELQALQAAASENETEQEAAEREASIQTLTDSIASLTDKQEELEETIESLQASIQEQKALLKDNPLTWLKKIKKQGVLALVLDSTAVSSTEIDQSDLCSQRTLNTGSGMDTTSSTATQNLLFQYYLQEVFSCYTSEEKDGTLDYEMEYCLIGKDSDTTNLKKTVKRLLLLREGINYAYLLTDAAKQEKALTLAVSIASAFALPELAPVIEQGILAAWAYAESLSDVRILLNGYKVSLVKTSAQWHTDLDDLSGALSGTKGKKQKGLTYAQYLQILLSGVGKKKLTYRAMDLIEEEEDVQMDTMVSQMDCTYRFEAKPLFWSFVSLGSGSLTTLTFPQTQLLTYTP